jgi:hypothetical protein
VDPFLERMDDVQRLDGSRFDTGDLPDGGPLVVVPAAP